MIQNKPYIVGVTGGIATGKSTATNYIKMRGYEVVDFDKIAHDILDDKLTKSQIISTFGEEILDENENIDRKKLGALVFNNRKNLEKLNNITHPKIYEKGREKIKTLLDERIIFLDIPLLFETKNIFEDFYENVDEIWLINSKGEAQTSRLMIRDKLSVDEAKERIRLQMPMKVKSKLSDVVIYNNSDIYALYDEIRIVLNNLERRVELK